MQIETEDEEKVVAGEEQQDAAGATTYGQCKNPNAAYYGEKILTMVKPRDPWNALVDYNP